MDDISEAIRLAAREKIRAQARRVQRARAESVRRQRRSLPKLPTLEARRPLLWSYDPSHDPYHVRARAAVIGHAVSAAVRSGAYAPFPPAGFEVMKPSGGVREVTAFAIADEVVSKRLYGSLLEKNRSALSPRSYAYRPDLGVNDAIRHIATEWSGERRLYLAHFDFRDYFGSISHDHIWSTIRSLGLATTRTERRLLGAFMAAPLPTMLPATRPAEAQRRVRGVPQGTTVSLLLANIAATPLDRELERLGASFARFADDMVIWSRDYATISRAVESLHQFADRSGFHINHSKSTGVSILVGADSGIPEFRHTDGIEFLSHRISLDFVSLSDRTVRMAKENINGFIYSHLLREPINGTQDLRRLKGGLDRDYIALVWELRRYLYGLSLIHI